MSAKYVITPPDDLLNSNDRLHWRAKAKRTAYWRDAAAWTVKRNSGGITPLATAHITVSIRFPTNHRRDVGNYHPTAKAIVDGLVDAGLLLDDNDSIITGPDLRRELPNGPLRVTVLLEGEPA